ncbi:MAG TPA: TauD/TfdA family dioxygenase [Candidatus Saccharimonadales bacterium]|nr:TauD/TfdA family dioxygenase [Candidatus Saccharimonadales bacterium]
MQSKNRLTQGAGAVVLRGLAISSESPELAQLASITIGSAYGRPTKTDKQLSQIAWPVRFDPDAPIRSTFSQTKGEAQLHTDSQYFEHPEKFFGLFCIVADEQGKGTNTLVYAKDVVHAVAKESPESLEVLSKKYPFRVPTAFTEMATDSAVEITWAPIITMGTVRYRYDTLCDGIAAVGGIDEAQLTALALFEQKLAEAPSQAYHLSPDEALLVNNHTMLHARTPFDNPERLLYRVRMEEP